MPFLRLRRFAPPPADAPRPPARILRIHSRDGHIPDPAAAELRRCKPFLLQRLSRPRLPEGGVEQWES